MVLNQFARRTRRRSAVLIAATVALGLAGCGGTSYSTPGQPADFKAIGVNRETLTDASINQALAKLPLATFPCSIAAVRIQAPGYSSESAETFGTGNYCVVTTRNIEDSADMDLLSKLPQVKGIAPLNRLMLPQTLNTDLELRQAAASLHADMLLIYTLDTKVQVEDHLVPLSVVTIGLSPNLSAQVVTTASAVLMDTRNGYFYGYSEATEKSFQMANGWTSAAAVDAAVKRNETKAFGTLVKRLQITWGDVVKNFGTAPKVAGIEDKTVVGNKSL